MSFYREMKGERRVVNGTMTGMKSGDQQWRKYLSALAEGQARGRHRRLVLLTAQPEWARSLAAPLADGEEHSLWIGTEAPAGGTRLPAGQASRVLGREFRLVVFDAFCGFDPDALAAVAGTLRGGGLLLLLAPPLEQWPAFPDPERERITVAGLAPTTVGGRFLRRFATLLRRDPDVLILAPQRPLPPLPVVAPLPAMESEGGANPHPAVPDGKNSRNEAFPGVLEGSPCLTPDQAAAVEALLHVVEGQRRRPVVLSADRGRGKSAALGLAAGEVLAGRGGRVLVTGPSLEAVAPVFEHAARLLPGAQRGRAHLERGDARLEFIAPDRLLRERPRADLLLVDEAASLPLPLLEGLLRHYPRIAFATTVHGYEGTGRGFVLRFGPLLDRVTRGWRRMSLETPVRFAPGDPLERLLFRALLLEAEPAPVTEPAGEAVVEQCDRDRLASDEQTLGEFYGLLVQAHYRTRPYDLRHLLDGPNLSLWLLRREGRVVAVAVTALEGGFDATTAEAIRAGTRRPHGHLLPESLAAHLGFVRAPRMSHLRVLRIAVHPQLQGRGLGSRLLGAVLERMEEGIDLVGASFGATVPLLHFWFRAGFVPVRLSSHRSAVSGSHSALMVRACSARGRELLEAARSRFLDHFPVQLSDPLRELEPELALALLAGAGPAPVGLDEQDREALYCFSHHHRVFEESLAPLRRLACRLLTDTAQSALLDPVARRLLVCRVLQGRPWEESARLAGLAGRREVIEALRAALRPLVPAPGTVEDPVSRNHPAGGA